MIISKIAYDNSNKAEITIFGEPHDIKIELKGIFHAMIEDRVLAKVLLDVVHEMSDELDEELGNERK